MPGWCSGLAPAGGLSNLSRGPETLLAGASLFPRLTRNSLVAFLAVVWHPKLVTLRPGPGPSLIGSSQRA